MSNIQIFNNNEFGKVRVVTKDNGPWFIGKDVTEILGYSNSRKALSDHVDDEDKGVTKCDTLGGKQDLTIINESGLYSLVLSSKLSNAKKFKRWVTSEVLPSIRKNGMYAVDELLDNPDLLIATATKLKEEREKRIAAEKQIEAQKPKVIFADALEVSESSILVGDLAKLLRQNGINVGQNRLFEDLRKDGYLISRKGDSYNMPTQYSMDLGLFEIKVRTINNPDGSVRTTKTSKVTGKGQIYFVNKFLQDQAQEEVACSK